MLRNTRAKLKKHDLRLKKNISILLVKEVQFFVQLSRPTDRDLASKKKNHVVFLNVIHNLELRVIGQLLRAVRWVADIWARVASL